MQTQLNRMEVMLAEMISVQGKILARLDAMDERFESVDKRFEGIDNRFDAVDKRFDTLESNLHDFKIETQVSFRQLEKRIDTRLRLIESDLDETMKDIVHLKNASN